MKLLQILIMGVLMILMETNVSAAEIPLRGVIEGFYGKPWTAENRVDLMKFCHENNLNAYIYAPKNDPYHRDKWRLPYPAEKIAELAKLVETANNNGVRFIFAVSPGLDLNYEGEQGNTDFNLLIDKLDSVYKIGVRDFAIFFDDLKDNTGNHYESGKRQADFLNKLRKVLREKHSDIAPLITVPTEYFLFDMIYQGYVKTYTAEFASNLDKDIVVLYTGNGVVCDGITENNFEVANKIYGRNLGIWWNYPVNDYPIAPGSRGNAKLALGAIEKLPTHNVQAIFFNPMGQYQLSKIALETGAVYANSPETYDAEKAWNTAIENQFGKLALAMKIFASHSQHMENSWAKVGAPDSQEFTMAAHLTIEKFKAGEEIHYDRIAKLILDMEWAADTLLEKLPAEILTECQPQLLQFKRIALADRLALYSLQTKTLDPKLKILRDEIAKYAPVAILSEQAALKFVDDVLALLN